MADHFVAVARGVEGEKYSDFTTGTSSAATALFEFRVLDGVTPKKTEVLKALKAIERFFENAQQVTTAGFDVSG
jgi:hypothetical protein